MFWIRTKYFKTLSDMESKISPLSISWYDLSFHSWPSSSSIAHVLVPVHNNQNWPNTQNLRTFPIKVYLETAGKAVNYWLSIWPPPREWAGSPVGILRTHICSGAPGRWSSISDIDGMAPKTSVLPFPACAFFPRGSTSAHLADMNPNGPARSSSQVL